MSRVKHTSSMLGVTLCERDDRPSLTSAGKNDDFKFYLSSAVLFSAGVLVTAHADEPLKVDTRGVTAKMLL